MITAVDVELRKIVSTRLFAGLLATAAAMTLFVTVVESLRSGTGVNPVPSMSTAAGQRAILTDTGFGILLATVFGTIVATGEFRHKTATDTYLDEPNRARVLVAKVIAGVAAGAVFGLLAAALATAVGLGIAEGKGFHVALPTARIIRFAVGAVVASGLMAGIGVGLGSLIRSQIGAIIAVFAWTLGIEQLTGGLSSTIAPYLPMTAASTMAGANTQAAMPPVPSGLDILPFGVIAALLVGLAIVFSLIAAYSTVQRDIT